MCSILGRISAVLGCSPEFLFLSPKMYTNFHSKVNIFCFKYVIMSMNISVNLYRFQKCKSTQVNKFTLTVNKLLPKNNLFSDFTGFGCILSSKIYIFRIRIMFCTHYDLLHKRNFLVNDSLYVYIL